MTNHELISQMKLENGFKTFRFQIDLRRSGARDQENKFVTRIGRNTDISWKFGADYRKNTINLDLLDSPFSSAFVVFRLAVCEKKTGRVVWDVAGARIFRSTDQISFIDSDSADSGSDKATSGSSGSFTESGWICQALTADDDGKDGLTLNIILDIPTDYGSGEFRRSISKSAHRNPIASTEPSPYAERTFNLVESLYDQIRDPRCKLADVILVVVADVLKAPVQFYCHRIVLATHSTVFNDAFTSPTANNGKMRKVLGNPVWLYSIVGYDLETIKSFLYYFYHGVLDVSVDPETQSDSLSLVEAANGTTIEIQRLFRLTRMAFDFGVDDLLTNCENQLIELCELACYRVSFCRLAVGCKLARLKSILVALMAGVRGNMDESANSAILKYLHEECERKMFLPVVKLD